MLLNIGFQLRTAKNWSYLSYAMLIWYPMLVYLLARLLHVRRSKHCEEVSNPRHLWREHLLHTGVNIQQHLCGQIRQRNGEESTCVLVCLLR